MVKQSPLLVLDGKETNLYTQELETQNIQRQHKDPNTKTNKQRNNRNKRIICSSYGPVIILFFRLKCYTRQYLLPKKKSLISEQYLQSYKNNLHNKELDSSFLFLTSIKRLNLREILLQLTIRHITIQAQESILFQSFPFDESRWVGTSNRMFIPNNTSLLNYFVISLKCVVRYIPLVDAKQRQREI